MKSTRLAVVVSLTLIVASIPALARTRAGLHVRHAAPSYTLTISKLSDNGAYLSFFNPTSIVPDANGGVASIPVTQAATTPLPSPQTGNSSFQVEYVPQVAKPYLIDCKVANSLASNDVGMFAYSGSGGSFATFGTTLPSAGHLLLAIPASKVGKSVTMNFFYIPGFDGDVLLYGCNVTPIRE